MNCFYIILTNKVFNHINNSIAEIFNCFVA